MTEDIEIAISGSPDYDYYTAAYVTKEGIHIKGDAGEYGISPLTIPWADVLKHAPAEAIEEERAVRQNICRTIDANWKGASALSDEDLDRAHEFYRAEFNKMLSEGVPDPIQTNKRFYEVIEEDLKRRLQKGIQ